MNKFYKQFYLLFFFGTILILTSCNTDNKDEPIVPPDKPNVQPSQSEIVEELCQCGWETSWDEEYSEWGDGNFCYRKEKTILYFFGNGKGIARLRVVEDDTYFGKSRRDEPYSFEYDILDGNMIDIYIQNGSPSQYICMVYKNGVLKDKEGKETLYTKTDYDKEWVETAKYSVMDDDERYNFPIAVIIDGDYKESYNCYHDEQEELNLYCGLVVPASSKAYARKISYIRAVYKLEGTSWCHLTGKMKNLEHILSINENEDSKIIDFSSIPFDSKDAIVNVELYFYDEKYKKEVYVETLQFALQDHLKNVDFNGDQNPVNNGFSTTVTPGIVVTSLGDYPWTMNGSTFTSGNNGKSSSKSILYIQVDPLKNGYNELSFDWEVSSEQKYDKLIIKEVDGLVSSGEYGDELLTESGEKSGHVDEWYVMGGSPRTFIVIYEKDGSSDGGKDRAIIKNIKLNNQ